MGILEAIHAQQRADDIDSKYVFVHGPSPFDRYRKKDVMPLTGKLINLASLREFLTGKFRRPDLKVHDFRKTFSTWAHEDGRFKHNDIEMALGHAPEGNKSRASTIKPSG